MKVLGYLIVLLADRLVLTIGKVIANWSLDTVNTKPLTLSPGQEPRWECRNCKQVHTIRKCLLLCEKST